MMLKIDQLRSVMELYPSTIWAKRAGVVLGVLRIEREPVEAAKLLRVVQPDMPVLDEKTQKVIGGEKVLTVFDENGEKTVKTEKLAEAPAHASHHQHFTVKSAGSRSAIEYDQMSADLVNFLSWAGEPAPRSWPGARASEERGSSRT